MKSILLHVDSTPSSANRLLFSVGLAGRLDATLTIVFGTGPANLAPRFAYSASAYADVLDVRTWKMQRDEARHTLERALPSDSAPVAWAELGGSDVTAALVQEAAYADLVVLGASEPDMEGLAPRAGFVESVILDSGRPVVVLPAGQGGAAVFRTVLVAWNGSPQSARAVTAALPLLRIAERVEVLGWSQAPLAGRFTGIDIGRFLERHGIAATVVRREPALDVGGEISQAAREINADLVVMGCFGHGRLRERVLGGASRSILRAVAVPTLMAH